MKISIIGNCGSGKTTLARRISQKFKVPHIQLDRFWFEAGGLKAKKDDADKKQQINDYIKNKVESFVLEPHWISDGFYSKVQKIIYSKADQLVFIDIPMRTRIFNHIKRIFTTERHPELTSLDEFLFIFEIIKRTFVKDPKIREFIKTNPDKVVHLKSYKEVQNYFDSLE